MNDLRTAAQQALEALEFFRDTAICSADTEAASEAITALRAALAQQAEPVAHFGSAYVNENGVHITTVLGPVAIPQDAKLYTAPPQRKPLTEEEIYRATGHCGVSKYTAINITRAVEAKHGIKESP